MTEIARVTINNFDERIKLAEKRKVIPILKDGKKKIAAKYLKGVKDGIYQWSMEGKLVDTKTKIIIPANPKVAGHPRWWKINGQDIYSQKIKQGHRAAIMGKLKDLYKPHLAKLRLPDDKYPLSVTLEFHIMDEGINNIDNDNKWIYEKLIQDSMTELKIIPDDNPYYIFENIKRTFFVNDPKDIKLEIIINAN